MSDLRPALRELFGFDDFRPGQEAVVRAALAGVDTLAVMPTGAGKSLTYQLAAMLRPSPTLVLSPLIALMKDQVDKLPPRIGATATFVNSSLGPAEAGERLESVRSGATRILYAAPERLRQESFVRTLRSIGVGLVVIDEVHCVSMWGHDFRPDYLFIRRALDELAGPAVLGMTATATPANASAIADALGRRLELVRTSVHRSNLRYDVERAENAEERLRALLHRLRGLTDGVAIVYARSRRSCEEIARTLRGHGIRAEHYHAGLEARERTRVQEAFVDGRTPVVVATTAFGMGIDKANVRLVALANHPDSLESYVQMVGRAGRDGRPSDTVLLAGDADAAALRRFALGDVPTPELLRRVYRALRDAGGTVEPEALDRTAGDGHDPRVLVGMLEQAGIVRRGYDAGRALRVELLPVAAGAGGAVDMLLDRYARESAARVERIVAFAEVERCRHLQVAEHFGETLDGPCGACDVCAPRDESRTAPVAAASRPLPEDPARTIVDAVDALTWPLGRRSLVAMLRGSVKAPPSARRSTAYGALAAASEAEVTRWVRALEAAGALVEVESEGFRVLHTRPSADLPSLGRPLVSQGSEPLVAELRAWRSRRAQEDGVPAFVVLHDTTLHELAARRPASSAELAGVRGLGPAKLERYGPELLAVLATA
ncbi:MAG TPA: ATP-dependent DNA helicase RecQ [Gaiella sp.]|uniref:RecQ family ATP-dependent DNA helicase n=1 Tax=Gaiella sp. TaxID=2663207 RepID=UPI002D80BD9C|nr:ATP-dependent DNA helicase RecQ [Gaiella sp.]HET9286454.1 ATP-dependent DNA helicase RecQ [Gaiella sp.]